MLGANKKPFLYKRRKILSLTVGWDKTSLFNYKAFVKGEKNITVLILLRELCMALQILLGRTVEICSKFHCEKHFQESGSKYENMIMI